VDTRNATHSADHGGALRVVYDDFTCAQVGDEQPVRLRIEALVVNRDVSPGSWTSATVVNRA